MMIKSEKNREIKLFPVTIRLHILAKIFYMQCKTSVSVSERENEM